LFNILRKYRNFGFAAGFQAQNEPIRRRPDVPILTTLFSWRLESTCVPERDEAVFAERLTLMWI
jgi:hypothetical protein